VCVCVCVVLLLDSNTCGISYTLIVAWVRATDQPLQCGSKAVLTFYAAKRFSDCV